MINVLDHGAAGDGVTDDTGALQLAIDTAFGDTLLFPEGRAFKVDPGRGLRIGSHRHLSMKGARIVSPVNVAPRSRCLEIVIGATDVSIEGGEVIGSRESVPGLQWGKGIIVDSAAQVRIEGVTSRDHYFDGVYIGGNTPCVDVELRDVTCRNNRRNGCSITNAMEVFLHRCSFTGSNGQDPQSGLHVEPNARERVTGLVAIRCIFGSSEKGVYMLQGHGAPGARYMLFDCAFRANTKYHLIGNGVEGLSVIRCDFGGEALVGVSIGAGTKGVTFSENTIVGTSSPLVLAGARDVKAYSNAFEAGLSPKILPAGGLPGVAGDVVMMGNEATR